MFSNSNKNKSKESDLDIISRFRNSHDQKYIGILFQRYTHLIFAVCMKYLKDTTESEDATMEIFSSLPPILKKHTITNFKSWLHSVAKNHCLMKLRKDKSKNEKADAYELFAKNSMESDGFEHQKDEKLLVKLDEALNELNSQQKKCIKLFYMEQKSYDEIVIITGYTVKNVKSYLQNGKRNLKNHLIEASEKK